VRARQKEKIEAEIKGKTTGRKVNVEYVEVESGGGKGKKSRRKKE